MVVTEKRINPLTGTLRLSRNISNTFRHEVGHAVDDVLGIPSQSKAFIKAYEEDVKNISIFDKDKIGYYLQEGRVGLEETFAEVYASLTGGGSFTKIEVHTAEQFLRMFPKTAGIVRGFLY